MRKLRDCSGFSSPGCHCAVDSLSLLFLNPPNPPYSGEISEGRNTRMERRGTATGQSTIAGPAADAGLIVFDRRFARFPDEIQGGVQLSNSANVATWRPEPGRNAN